MNTTQTQKITPDEAFALNHWSMFGSDGYPVVKRGHVWFVEGMRGCGSCPARFNTKREAVAQWEAYIDILIDKKAGRI